MKLELEQFVDRVNLQFGFSLDKDYIYQSLLDNDFTDDQLIRFIFDKEGVNPDFEISLYQKVKNQLFHKVGTDSSAKTKIELH